MSGASEPIRDYEDLTGMQLTPAELEGFVSPGGECVFNWTNSQGYPVGVVVAYIWHENRFFTTCAERRARVPALRKRPQSAVIVNNGTYCATWKGDSIVHSNADPGFNELKQWFYGALSGTTARPDDDDARNFQTFLDSPHRVIIETEANLVVSFDVGRFRSFTAEAVAAGLADT